MFKNSSKTVVFYLKDNGKKDCHHMLIVLNIKNRILENMDN